MQYRFFESVDRTETAKEDIILARPASKERAGHTITRETGDAVIAHYYLDGLYDTDRGISNEQLRLIGNAIKALILLKGEESVDEQLITKFIKKTTGVKVKYLTISIATKTYTYSYRLGGKYQSDEIDLKSLKATVSNSLNS